MKPYSIYILIFLNLWDGIITYIGLNQKFYTENNSFLDIAYQNDPKLFILIKLIIPTIVLAIIVIITSNQKISYIVKYMIYLSNVVYSIVMLYHACLIYQLMYVIY